jgi:hypothetical protein
MANHTLIVHCTFGGNNGRPAASLIAGLGTANVAGDEIRRHAIADGLRAAGGVALRRATPILMPLWRAADYDVVLPGSPVWMGRGATPVRTLPRLRPLNLARSGVFSTSSVPDGLAKLREIGPRQAFTATARAAT